jgi:hypothetical protein
MAVPQALRAGSHTCALPPLASPHRKPAAGGAHLVCILVTLLLAVSVAAPGSASAQEQVRQADAAIQAPSPPAADRPAGDSPPGDQENDGGGWLPDWLGDPGRWASDVFEQSVAALLDGIAGFLRTAVAAVLDSTANFITRTPPAVSYASPTVRGLWEVTRTIANGTLVLVALWGGFTIMTRQQLSGTYAETGELVSRLVLGALLANTSLWWGQLAVDANNALCLAFGEATLPAWERADGATQALAAVLATLVYLVTSLLLLLQQLMRLALLDLLLVVAPLALICWVLPATQGWARRWSSLFCTVVFVQFLQVATLKLGASLVLELAPASEDTQVVTLLLGVAVLALTLKLPALLQAGHDDGLGFARFYAYRRGARALEGASGKGSGR